MQHDARAETLRQLAADGEAETGARVRARVACIDLAELLEDGVLHVERDARALVGHARGHAGGAVAAHAAARGDHDAGVLGRELDRVGHEVEQDLLQLARVALDAGQVVLDVRLDGDAPGERLRAHDGGEPLDHIPHARGADRHLEPARLDLGHLQQFVDHLQQIAAAVQDVGDVAPPLGIGARIGARDLVQQLGEADDRVERRAQLVGDVGEELALEAVRLEQAHIGLGELADLEVEALVHGTKLALSLLQAVEHAVEGPRQSLEVVARGELRARGGAPLLDALGHIGERTHGAEDEPAQDEVEHEHGQRHHDDARGDDVDAVHEDLGLGEVALAVDHQDRRDRVVGTRQRRAVDARLEVGHGQLAPLRLADDAGVAVLDGPAARFLLEVLRLGGVGREPGEGLPQEGIGLGLRLAHELAHAVDTAADGSVAVHIVERLTGEDLVGQLARDLELAVGDDGAGADPRSRERTAEQRDHRDPEEDLALVGE